MKPTYFLLAMFMFFQITVVGQTNHLKIKKDENGSIREFIVSDSISRLLTPTSFFKDYLKIKQGDEFILDTAIKYNSVAHFVQYFKGVRVRYGGYTFHFKNSKITLCNGKYMKFKDINVDPTVSKDQVKDIYTKYLNIDPQDIVQFEANLLIDMIISNDGKEEAKLLYQVFLIDKINGFSDIALIDAQTGVIVRTEPMFDNLTSSGTLSTRYSGTQNANTEFYNNTYNLSDYSKPGKIHTWDAHNGTNITLAYEITDLNNVWTTQEFPNNLDMALDVHWAMQKIYDHFASRYSIYSYDNNNHIISNYVRFVFDNQVKDNSGFSSLASVFSFGEGQTKFRPIASLDAIAHEYGHAITYSQINYDKNNITHASFNEGLSDIWAAILEYRIRPNNVWKIGEQIDLQYGCLRNIQVPHDNTARWNMADTYQSTYFNDHLEPYIRSGIFSHWFYLLVNGGSGVNERGNSYKVISIGMDAAEDIIKHSVYGQFLDNSALTYGDIRDQVCNAVVDKYGENSLELQQVKNAWYAVGVGIAEPQMSMTISGATGGNDYTCQNDNLTCTLNNAPSNNIALKNWSSNCLNVVSGNNTNTCVLRVNSNCGGSNNIVNLTITSTNGTVENITAPIQWIGPPSMASINGPSTTKVNTSTSYYAIPNYSSGTTYSWWTSPTTSNIYPYSGTNMANIYFNSTGGYTVYARALNLCGQNTPLGKFVMVNLTGSLSISPNPATDQINVSIINEEALNKDSSFDSDQKSSFNSLISDIPKKYTITITDNIGTIVYNAVDNSNKFIIEVGSLRNGNYVLIVSDGINKYNASFIINRK